MTTQRVIVAGSRTISDECLIDDCMFKVYAYYSDRDIEVEWVVGGAAGVDTIAEGIGNSNGNVVTVFEADWKRYGKSAGYKRNVQMAEYADELLAIWDGKSKGTKHMIDIARAEGLVLEIVVL